MPSLLESILFVLYTLIVFWSAFALGRHCGAQSVMDQMYEALKDREGEQ